MEQGRLPRLKFLLLSFSPPSGEVFLNNINVVDDPDQARCAFGIVFQDPSLDDELTAYENMEFHGVLYQVRKKIRKPRIEQLLKIVELWERRNDLVKEFSGGMKRRLEIARGILHHPKILFLDEPTLGLDPQTRNLIWNYVVDLNRKEKITIFLTTHIMEEAEKVAAKIAVIDHGKIVAQGSSEELEQLTKTSSLEEAFLELTGREIREEHVSSAANLRMRRRVWRR